MDFASRDADELHTGTTIMAVAYDGGVIMIHDKIFMCRSGSAADTQAVSDYVRHYLASHAIETGRPPLVKTAANLCKRICYGNKEKLLAAVIVAGYDAVSGGTVWVIPLGGTCVQMPFAIGGSGSTYIYGHVDAQFKPGMSKEECKAFVTEAVGRAMARDGSSGGIIRIVDICADGVTRDYLTANTV